jgi:hypothetical protein
MITCSIYYRHYQSREELINTYCSMPGSYQMQRGVAVVLEIRRDRTFMNPFDLFQDFHIIVVLFDMGSWRGEVFTDLLPLLLPIGPGLFLGLQYRCSTNLC